MSVEVKVPMLPESVADATVAAWHKQAGEAVRRDENLVDLETDKVVLEVPAPCDGVLESIAAPSGTTVTHGALLARIQAGDAVEEAQAQKPTAPATEASSEPALSPSARRLVEENDLNPATIQASGRDGRITKSDVLEHLRAQVAAAPPETKQPPVAETTPAVAPSPAADGVQQQRVPMSRLRLRIAERMVEAQHSAAMLTSFNEVNLQAVMDIRKQHKERFEQRHGVRLGLMSFFVRAACDALRKHPIVNASIEGSDVVYHSRHDIGIAVSSERGLVVPVLRDAGNKGFAEIEQDIAAYAKQAREGSLKLDDLQGGTFTITNGGVFGSLLSTPILNMPQSAILGMHTIKERPVVENGAIVARPMMYLALTYDHRLVDGKDAVLFLVAIKDGLEDPNRLLLDL